MKKKRKESPVRVRLPFAIEQLEKHNIEYSLKNEEWGIYTAAENPTTS